MSPELQLRKLLREGCLIEVQGLYFHPAAGGLLDGALRWINVFPESQKDSHAQPFDKAEVVHNRDLALYRDGKLVAYVAPFAEWDNSWSEFAKEERGRWLAFLQDEDNARRFQEFQRAEWQA